MNDFLSLHIQTNQITLMKKLLLLLLVIFTVFNSFSQKKETLKVESNWCQTLQPKYKVTKTNRQRDKNGVKEDSSSYTFTFKILDSTANEYRIEWVCDESPVGEMSEEITQLIEDKLGDFKMIYKVDHKGIFKEIENWQQVGDFLKEAFALQLKQAHKDTSEINSVNKQLLQVYSSKFGIENVILKELRLFHFPYGYEHSIKDTLTFQQDFPNPLTQGTIKGITKYYFSDVNIKNHQAVFNQKSIIDGAEANKILSYVMDKYLAASKPTTEKDKADSLELKNSISQMKFANNTSLYFRYNYQDNLPVKIDFERLIDVDLKIYDLHKTAKIKIERIN